MAVYNACIVSTLLYGSKRWTTYSKQERKMNSFHMHCLCHILSIQWSDKVPNAQILECASLSTMFKLLRQCRLWWLATCAGWRMVVYPRTSSVANLPLARELLATPNCASKRSASATWMPWKSSQIESWEYVALDCSRWRSVVRKQFKSKEEKILTTANKKRATHHNLPLIQPMRQRLSLLHWTHQPQLPLSPRQRDLL